MKPTLILSAAAALPAMRARAPASKARFRAECMVCLLVYCRLARGSAGLVQAADEIGDGRDHNIGLVFVRGMAAIGNLEQACLRHCSARSEEHTSELQSLMRISYAVFCLKKKKHYT